MLKPGDRYFASWNGQVFYLVREEKPNAYNRIDWTINWEKYDANRVKDILYIGDGLISKDSLENGRLDRYYIFRIDNDKQLLQLRIKYGS